MLNDLLKRIADAGRSLKPGGENPPRDLMSLCEALLQGKGEATGIATALDILEAYRGLDAARKVAFFSDIQRRFGSDEARIRTAIKAFEQAPGKAARELHFASEPRTQELIRRLNRAPGGTLALVAMRRDLLDAAVAHPALIELDRDFRHLLGSWFNRGFLELRRISWATPAETLAHIIEYEAVHEITSWDDLRGRVGTPDRRLYGFFHPAIPSEPLIFVEVALTLDMPDSIDAILSEQRKRVAPEQAKTAVFYSISNCHTGLRGISFGNFLIKQVVEELRRELQELRTFVTLSPVPGLRRWAVAQWRTQQQHDKEEEGEPSQSGAAPLTPEQLALIEALEQAPPASADPVAVTDAQHKRLLSEIAARYLTQRSERGGALDAVARFHLGNGARLERIHAGADSSARGLKNSWGVMVNYLYALPDIERNHELYASTGEVVCSSAVRRLAKD